MHDVAARAGVSVKTVSNVVNGYPYIRETTRARVLAAIDELGYQMNVYARTLRSGRSGMIGLALPEVGLTYFAELSDAVMRAAERRGYRVLIEQTSGVREREIEVLTSMRRSLIDGMIFSPLALGPADVEYVDTDFPLVLLGERIFGSPADHVTMANVAAAAAATRHLIELGRTRVAVIGAHPGESVGTAGFRLEGYESAMRDAGLPVDRRRVVEAGLWHRADGAAAARALIGSGVAFDAVFCFNDTLALGALRVFLEHGLRVPDDVALVGFDNIEDTLYSSPSITTINPGRQQIAETAVEVLLERIADGTGERTPREIEAEYALVVRESTAGAAWTTSDAVPAGDRTTSDVAPTGGRTTSDVAPTGGRTAGDATAAGDRTAGDATVAGAATPARSGAPLDGPR